MDTTVVSEPNIPVVMELPSSLVERAERLVERGLARDRDALLTAAIEDFIARLEERLTVDAELLAMANDAEFQALNLRIAEEFAGSDYQALQEGEDEAR